MNYCSFLETYAKKRSSLVCLGLDPILERIPLTETSIEKKLTIFFESILNQIVQRNIYPSAVKPNYAFYAQYGFDGLHALKNIIDMYKKEGIPVILDSKRGDIGNTSSAYAKETFSFFEADAVTLSPYMGYDTLNPFVTDFPEKGYYILCRTSNKSAVDFQDKLIDGKPLYMHVAETICAWSKDGLGAVIGATYPDELSRIMDVFDDKSKSIPLLIPGIGTQGGDLNATVAILKKSNNIHIHRINSSSGILYAYERKGNTSFDKAAVDEIHILNNEINKIADI
jgi:orotidine-5'-phosphate decarboxylase